MKQMWVGLLVAQLNLALEGEMRLVERFTFDRNDRLREDHPADRQAHTPSAEFRNSEFIGDLA
jgi:hypothetical protein